MARNKRTAADFDLIANELLEASNAIKAISELMQKNGMPDVLIHGSSTLNRNLPGVLEWVDKATADVKIQLRSYLAGNQSSAEFMKQKNERQKLAAAKKPPVKKSGKEKGITKPIKRGSSHGS